MPPHKSNHAAAGKKTSGAKKVTATKIEVPKAEDFVDSADDLEHGSEEKPASNKRKAEYAAEGSKPAKAAKQGGNNSVFVGQLNRAASVEEIREFFSQAGTVVDVRIKRRMKNRDQNPGFCHIEMSSQEERQAAIELNGAEFQGLKLNVNAATDPKPKVRNDKIGEPTNTLFCANLSFEADRNFVQFVFEKFGPVTRCSRIMSKGYDTGIAYVEFADIEDAKKALEAMQGETIKGRPVRLDFAQKREDNGKGNANKRKNFSKMEQKPFKKYDD